MTIKRITIGALICIIISAIIMLLISQAKHSFYKNLIKQTEENISKWNQEKVLDKDSRVQEIKYFQNKNLRAIDILDEAGEVVRRDIFDTKAHVRVRRFYLNRKPIHQHFLNEKGEITVSKSLVFIPVSSGRLGY